MSEKHTKYNKKVKKKKSHTEEEWLHSCIKNLERQNKEVCLEVRIGNQNSRLGGSE